MNWILKKYLIVLKSVQFLSNNLSYFRQCDSGASATFYNATPYDQTGNNYEYPIHLSKPIVVKTDLDNYGHVYSDPNLLSTVNLWSWSDQCTWSSVPTLGLLKNLNACENGVPCPVQTGRQTLPVTLDFTKYNVSLQGSSHIRSNKF